MFNYGQIGVSPLLAPFECSQVTVKAYKNPRNPVKITQFGRWRPPPFVCNRDLMGATLGVTWKIRTFSRFRANLSRHWIL